MFLWTSAGTIVSADLPGAALVAVEVLLGGQLRVVQIVLRHVAEVLNAAKRFDLQLKKSQVGLTLG